MVYGSVWFDVSFDLCGGQYTLCGTPYVCCGVEWLMPVQSGEITNILLLLQG